MSYNDSCLFLIIFQKLIKASPCSAVELCLINKKLFHDCYMLWKLFFKKITTENGNSFIDDTHRVKAPSNKTAALMKSMNMDI